MIELRTGGVFHYGLRSAEDREIWDKWSFQEIQAPERLIWRKLARCIIR
jgi:hypothetical protein